VAGGGEDGGDDRADGFLRSAEQAYSRDDNRFIPLGRRSRWTTDTKRAYETCFNKMAERNCSRMERSLAGNAGTPCKGAK
jgi:hypothetical protein